MGEVDSFITEEMWLVRDDGEAKWTEGITELITLGMDSWRQAQGQVERAHLVSEEVSSDVRTTQPLRVA
jgi:hypothetical protein